MGDGGRTTTPCSKSTTKMQLPPRLSTARHVAYAGPGEATHGPKSKASLGDTPQQRPHPVHGKWLHIMLHRIPLSVIEVGAEVWGRWGVRGRGRAGVSALPASPVNRLRSLKGLL
jgi:hypothetical protein